MGSRRGPSYPPHRTRKERKMQNPRWVISIAIGAGISLGAGSALAGTCSGLPSQAALKSGGSLYGLQHSNPVDAGPAYQGQANAFGAANDPLVGERVGGVNVFGGGLALYTTGGNKVGGVGVSGDTSCTDHMVAWRVRNTLMLDHLGTVGGVSGDPKHPDNIIFDITQTGNGGMLNPEGKVGYSKSGFGHPTCINNPDPSTLPAVRNP